MNGEWRIRDQQIEKGCGECLEKHLWRIQLGMLKGMPWEMFQGVPYRMFLGMLLRMLQGIYLMDGMKN